MYQIKERLENGTVILLAMVDTESEASTRVANLKAYGRNVWYVKE